MMYIAHPLLIMYIIYSFTLCAWGKKSTFVIWSQIWWWFLFIFVRVHNYRGAFFFNIMYVFITLLLDVSASVIVMDVCDVAVMVRPSPPTRWTPLAACKRCACGGSSRPRSTSPSTRKVSRTFIHRCLQCPKIRSKSIIFDWRSAPFRILEVWTVLGKWRFSTRFSF